MNIIYGRHFFCEKYEILIFISFQKLKRQEDMARRQQEIQKEAERQRKEAAERKFQERKEQRK